MISPTTAGILIRSAISAASFAEDEHDQDVAQYLGRTHLFLSQPSGRARWSVPVRLAGSTACIR